MNLHTETFLTNTRGGGKGRRVGVGGVEGGEGFSSLSLPFFFLSSVVLFVRSLSPLSLLSNNENDHSSSRALSVYTRP